MRSDNADVRKVYIDVSVIRQILFITGIQRVVREIVLRLYNDKSFKLVFLEYDIKKGSFFIVQDDEFLNYLRGRKFHGKMYGTKEYIEFGDLEKGSVFFDLDAVWMCRVKRSYLYPILKRNGVKIIVHIYDVICITHPQFFEGSLVCKFMDYIGAALLYADRVICNAYATKDDIDHLTEKLGITGKIVSVIPLGADFSQGDIISGKKPLKTETAAKDKKYILMVGTIEPRKNHKLLLDAYDIGLKDMGFDLIFAGAPGWKNEEFNRRLTAHEDYGKRIHLFTNQPDYEIDYLYKHAAYVAFLSYKEGFGLPIMEALAKGVPVIASDTPINMEIGQDKCIYFRQDDAVDMCDKIRATDNDTYKSIKGRLKDYKYCSWEETANRIKYALKEEM